MSVTPSSSPAAADGTPGGSFLGHLFGLYTAPRETFTSILARPNFWPPLVAYIFVALAFVGVWTQKAEPKEVVRLQFEEAGVVDKIPADRRDAIIDAQARGFRRNTTIGGALVPAASVFIVSALFLGVLAFVLGAEVRFRSVATVVAWSYLATGLVHTILMLTTYALKGDWNLLPHQVLQTSVAGLLLDRSSTSAVTYALIDSFDLFSFATMALLTIGLGVATRRPALGAVVGLWIVYIVFKLGLTALIPALVGR